MNALIDGVEVFLRENPAFSYNFYDFIDPAKVKGDTATSIEVSATVEAERVLGSRSMSERPSKREHVLDVGPGYWKGRIAPIDRAEGVIRCESVSGNGGWIAGIKDQRLRTLSLGNSADVTAQYQRETWTDEEDAVYFPLIDYGSFEGQANTYNVEALKMRPAVRVWAVLAQAFGEIGYVLRIEGRLQNIWKKLVLPNVKDNLRSLSGCFATSEDASIAAVLLPQVYTAPDLNTTPIAVPFGTVVSDPDGNFPGTGASYIMPTSTDQLLQVSLCRFSIAFDPFADLGRSIRVGLWDTADGILEWTNVVLDNANGGQQLSHRFAEKVVPAGRTLFIGIQSNDGNPITISVPGAQSQVNYDPNPLSVPYSLNAPLVINTLCPDMTVGELVKDLTSLFCLTWTTDESTGRVTVSHYDDTLKPISTGRDFRGRENQAQPVKVTPYAPGQYLFRYNNDPKDRTLQTYQSTFPDPGYANTNRDIQDGTEPPKEISLKVAPTAMDRILGALFCPIMREEEGEVGEDFYDYVPRIMIADGVVTAPNTWVHAGDTLTVQPKCYFLFPGETRYGLSFGRETVYGAASPGLVEQHYRNRLDRLATAYILQIDLRLDDDELLSFDFTRPVYVDDGYGGGWYYIIKVENKQFGTDAFTRCELLQV